MQQWPSDLSIGLLIKRYVPGSYQVQYSASAVVIVLSKEFYLHCSDTPSYVKPG